MATSTLVKPLEIPFSETDEVAEFLSEKDISRSLLCEIADRVREHFPACPISLSVSHDWEGTNFNFLVMRAHTPDDPPTALKKLDEFDHAYWLDIDDRTRDLICVDVAPL